MATINTRTGTHVVLNRQQYTVRVSSDHAMIDSGSRVDYTVWRQDLGITQVLTWGDDNRPDVGADYHSEIPEDVRQASIDYNNALVWLGGLIGRTRIAPAALKANPRVNERVEVYKGRKVPKGVYRIVKSDEGQYGPYYDLKNDADGKVYRYVSVDNCRLSDVSRNERLAGVDKLEDVPESYRGMILALSGLSISGYNERRDEYAVAIGALCDALEETDSPHAKYIPALRAYAYAHLTKEGSRQFHGW